MAGLALSGLASGVDTNSIVDQLMAIERQKVTRINNQSTSVTAHQTGLKAVSDKLNALSTAAAALTDSAAWKTAQTSTSSDTTKVAVAQLDGAGIGGHTVSVDRLASSAQHGFAYTSSGAAGTFTITAGASSATISVGANATAKDIATAINASTSAPVYAAVVKDDDGTERIVMSSRKTGSDNNFTVDTTSLGSGGALSEDTDYQRVGATLNALYSVDGVAKPASQTNAIENAIPGLRITLAGVTSSPVSITTAEATIDKSAIKTKVKAFVDAYNAVVALGRDDVAEKKVSDPSSTFEAQQGALYGDTGVTSWLSKLRLQVGKQYSGIGNAATMDGLADLGITSGKVGSSTAQAKSGTLELDETKLADALTNDPQAVRRLLGGAGTSALAQDVEKLTGDLGDVIDSRVASIDKQSRRITDDLARAETRLADREKRLKAQFAAMETALSNAQSTQSQLTSQLSSLS